jgi:cell division protein FtsZ
MQRKIQYHPVTKIRVVGVGSGGHAAVNALLDEGVNGVDFVAVDTDDTALRTSRALVKIRIGRGINSKRGEEVLAEQGQRAALISAASISQALQGADLVFIVCGLGGGTGTGASSIIAQIAKEQGALVVSIVTYPFSFEGVHRANAASKGVSWLKKWADTLIVIPNDRLLQLADGKIGFHQVYQMALSIWKQTISGIDDLVNNPGLINVDFADIQAIMGEGGGAIIATGRGKGENRARIAAEMATRSEILGLSIHGASGLIFNVCGGRDLSLLEVEEAAEIITSRAQPMANVIFGATINPALEGMVHITVLATGFVFQEDDPGKANGVAKRVQSETSNQPWQLARTQFSLANHLFGR